MKYCPQCRATLIDKHIDGHQRFVCSNDLCCFVHWNNPVPVVVAIVEYRGQYIIARNRVWPNGVFSLVSGYLEQGEAPEQAVLREVQEELSLYATIGKFIGHYIYAKKNQLLLCYEVQACGVLKLNHELVEYRLLTAETLAKYDFSPLTLTTEIISDWWKVQNRPS